MTDQLPNENYAALKLGVAMRKAREQQGLSMAAAAAALRVPSSVIDHLEAERFDAIGAPIFVRGHLRAYLRILGLPEVRAEHALQGLQLNEPVLQSRQHVSHLRFLVDRYAARAAYVVLTLAIVLPALYIATTRSPVDLRLGARSLDSARPAFDLSSGSSEVAAEVAAPAAQGSQSSMAELAIPLPTPESPASGEHEPPVMASITPFYRPPAEAVDAAAEPVDVVAATAAPSEPTVADAVDSNGWEFVFSEDSWVEILGVDGRRLEYGLVRGGERRGYAAHAVSKVALGNAGAVVVRRGGQSLDLAPFRRANVARFTVSSEGSLLPAGG